MRCDKCGGEVAQGCRLCAHCGASIPACEELNHEEVQQPIYAKDRAKSTPQQHCGVQRQDVKPVVPNYQPIVSAHTQDMSMGEWVVVLALSIIPIVNLVVLYLWAFTSHGGADKKNYARAALIVLAAVAALCVSMLGVVILNILSSAWSSAWFWM